MRHCLILLAASLAGAALAASIKVTFPGDGERNLYWTSRELPPALPDPTGATGKSVELDAPENADYLIVHDRKTGLAARKAVKEMAGSWTLTPGDMKFVFMTVIRVESEGQPVSAAEVEAAGPDKLTRSLLLTPSDKGEARFYLMPQGPVSVSVKYKQDGEMKSAPKQTFEAKPGERELTVSLPEGVETMAPPEAPPEKPAEPQAAKEDAKPAPNPFMNFVGSLFGILLSLAVLGGIGYGLYRYFTSKPGEAEGLLKQAGILKDPEPADNLPPTPAAPQPLKPIVLDDAAPVAAAVPMAAAVLNPRIVHADGQLFLIPEGSSVVTREGAEGLVFAGESSVSRRHATLTRQGDQITLSDEGSTNGTYVNGIKIISPTLLQPGDSIIFGKAPVRFEV